MNSLEIGRLMIVLDGVSSEVAEEAVDGLAEELSRRLGASTLLEMGAGALEVGALEMRAVTRGTLDAAALRGLIAEQFIASLAAAQEERVGMEEPT